MAVGPGGDQPNQQQGQAEEMDIDPPAEHEDQEMPQIIDDQIPQPEAALAGQNLDEDEEEMQIEDHGGEEVEEEGRRRGMLDDIVNRLRRRVQQERV